MPRPLPRALTRAAQLWDLGGQSRFRSMWERYCRGVNAIVYAPAGRCQTRATAQPDARPRPRRRRFVVDAADQNTLEVARGELHNLLKKQDGKEDPLAGIPLLVLGNKKDLPGALTERELIDRMDLQSLAQEREVCTYCISCKNVENIDITIDWLTKHSRGR